MNARLAGQNLGPKLVCLTSVQHRLVRRLHSPRRKSVKNPLIHQCIEELLAKLKENNEEVGPLCPVPRDFFILVVDRPTDCRSSIEQRNLK